MTELQAPVKDALRKTTTPAQVARMWHRIEARGRAPSLKVRRPAWSLVAVAAMVAALVWVFAWPRGQRTSPVFSHGSHGPLALADGAPFAFVQADREPRTLVLSDATRLVVGAGAALTPETNSGSSVELQQGVGRVDYDVTPGGPRRWLIDCGVAAVEVVGTSFVIEHSETRCAVEVSRGTVLVHDHTIPGRVVRLTAGMRTEITVPLGTPVAVAAPSAESPSTPPAAPSAAIPNGRPPSVASNAASVDESWRALAASGKNEKAYAELGPEGIASRSKGASVDDLFTLADVARLSGHPAEAVDPLERIVNDHPSDGRASVAALTLGRIQLRSLGVPSAAARSLEKAIALGIPSGLDEDAHALWIEALARAGEHERARAAYGQFITRFPASSRSAELSTWVRDP